VISGGVWFADYSQVWNPSLTPALPEISEAKTQADKYFDQLYKSIRVTRYSKTSFSNTGKTLSARYEVGTKKRTDKQLDIQINYLTEVKPFPNQDLTLPVIGGGGEFNFTFGHQGKLISHSGVWRGIQNVRGNFDVIPRGKVDAQFEQLMEGMKITSYRSYLAYYSAPQYEKQEFLYPVYVYDSSAILNEKSTQLKTILLPATAFDPETPKAVPIEFRPQDDSAGVRPGSTDPEDDDEATTSREVGISWYQAGRLVNAASNARSFLQELVDHGGWTKNFDWGYPNSRESDWNRNDDTWVDAADFVYFAGHADIDHWQLSNGNLTSNEVGSLNDAQRDLWGDQDLEWIIINACGPLYDDRLTPGVGSVFDRWAGAFDGLHLLLGYASVVKDHGTEGKAVAQSMMATTTPAGRMPGKTIIEAWFQAARDTQLSCNQYTAPYGPQIWAGALYVEKDGVSTKNDHLWGHGDVASDPFPGDAIYAIWTTT
jgi:hypothetical protein